MRLYTNIYYVGPILIMWGQYLLHYIRDQYLYCGTYLAIYREWPWLWGEWGWGTNYWGTTSSSS